MKIFRKLNLAFPATFCRLKCCKYFDSNFKIFLLLFTLTLVTHRVKKQKIQQPNLVGVVLQQPRAIQMRMLHMEARDKTPQITTMVVVNQQQEQLAIKATAITVQIHGVNIHNLRLIIVDTNGMVMNIIIFSKHQKCSTGHQI